MDEPREAEGIRGGANLQAERIRTKTPVCDQCQILVINNVPCHEFGCPNKNKPIQYRKRTRRVMRCKR